MLHVVVERRLNQDNSGRSLAEALRYRQKAARVRPDQEPVTARVPEPLMSQKTAHHTARVLAARAVAVRPRSLAAEVSAEAVEAQVAPRWDLVVDLGPLTTIKP